MTKLIAVDPGEKHCGVAVWGVSDQRTVTLNPEELFVFIRDRLPKIDVLVVEAYRVYPWVDHAFAAVATVEVIGVLRYLWKDYEGEVVWAEQDATIKKPTEKILRAKGIKLVGRNRHERDAELHGHHYLQRREAR